ncbi:hypothetical protein NDU88_007758 [Pleurodeles waltl]|uniref:Uncharacterized protein n=1 Tax=Pleurodeles waltl TaxID=8319 RepID=A0AAV7RR13_PLEWA|nr:hypothetical protein NDU88_007758 [Pleurodeles waltl]
MGVPGIRKGTKWAQEEATREENPHNKEMGEVGTSDYIIKTVNASLVAAVKALTWQSHKMDIHLELTHKLAQSVLILDSKLNSLCGKPDNWDNRWKEDKVVEGSRNDKIIDKLATLPDLLTSIIQHCKAATGNNKKTTGKKAVENQQETVSTEPSYKGSSTVLPEGEDGSRETEPNNMQQTVTLPTLQPSVATNTPENSTEEQDADLNHNSLCEHYPRIKHQPQLARQQKNMFKKHLKPHKKTIDRAALGITCRYPGKSRPTQSSCRDRNQA